MNTFDYINSVVGKPWVNRAEGPDAFDCFGIVLDSFRQLDHIELPQIPAYQDIHGTTGAGVNAEKQCAHWRRSQPRDGAVMVGYTQVGDAIVATHVGRCLAGGVLHALGKTDGTGSVQHHSYQLINRLFEKVEYYAFNRTS